MGINEEKIEELLQVVPEELTNKNLLALEQEWIAKQEARAKETTQEKDKPLRKFTLKDLTEDFADLKKLLKKFESRLQHQKVFIKERNVYGTFSAYKELCD